MMRRVFLWFASLAVMVQALAAAELKFDALRVGFKTYTNVTVLGANATDLYFKHAGGLANVKLKYVGPELQKRFNFDPEAAAAAEAEQMAENARFGDALAESLSDAAKKRSFEAEYPAEQRLLDSLSEKSFLYKPAPALEVEKWLSLQPDVEEKFLLISFWATWSVPCQRVIPDLNAYHKTLGDRLAVIGISGETEQTLVQMAGPRVDYFSAIDAKNRLAAALGVSTVPEVVLIDPKGIVRYQGHPAALNLKLLQSLVETPAG